MNVHELALASLNDHRLFTFLDLAGTFAFATSGAVAARTRGLDWFENSGHHPMYEEAKRYDSVLIEKLLPLAEGDAGQAE